MASPFGPVKRTALWVVQHVLNPLTLRMARRGIGPFSLVRHVGRKSGAVFETPIMLARVPDGFIAELTYGPKVNWYRNIVAAGGCEVVVRGRAHRVGAPEDYDTDAGLRAFGGPRAVVLRILRRHEFRLLPVAPAEADSP
jgi:deazaflavin-dependent oxidoreductase (nitroreductase family)